MNKGAVPCISSAVELMKSNECRRAMEQAESLYDSIMHKLKCRLPVEVEELSNMHRDANNKTVELYQKGALFDSDDTYINTLHVSYFNVR